MIILIKTILVACFIFLSFHIGRCSAVYDILDANNGFIPMPMDIDRYKFNWDKKHGNLKS